MPGPLKPSQRKARDIAWQARHGARSAGSEALRHEEFVRRVQQRAGLVTAGAAMLAVEASLTILGDRLRAEANGRDDEPDNRLIAELASLLPEKLGAALFRISEAGTLAKERESSSIEEFSLTEFFERVGAQTGVGLAEAERHACAVAQTLEEAAGDGGLDQIRSRLPDEYEFLFV